MYEHCVRALDKACTTGAHGLPLIGIGDWNDGMNRVGVEGKGESVWLAWFLSRRSGSSRCTPSGGGTTGAAARFRERADAYAAAVEANAWDGAWYRRAYFDDGTPLGTAAEQECRIDSIAQSWSVISGAGEPERQRLAMRSLEEHLVREDARLLMLLTPAVRRDAARPRATSRATCRACARTARSTPTPRSGSCSPPRSGGTATGPSSSSR